MMRSLLPRKMPIFVTAFAGIVVVFSASTALGQTRKQKPAAPKAVSGQGSAKAEPSAPEPSPTPLKRNERPGQTEATGGNEPKSSSSTNRPSSRFEPAYRYEFSQPEFVISSIKIEHDATGVGSISFKKKGSDEPITDPIHVSSKSITRINEALASLNFLSSTEDYQYEKDYSHLGVTSFALTQDGRSRTVNFSWTENKGAKGLMDEYRRIGNQFIWIFDIQLSRENQPLESPRLLDSLDSMIKRNEISDPHQMEPLLRELSNDERIPLIARNHASRLVAQFEKERKKAK